MAPERSLLVIHPSHQMEAVEEVELQTAKEEEWIAQEQYPYILENHAVI